MDLSKLNLLGLLLGYPMLLLALTVHECAHAWTADRLGDPTARFLGRVSLNPLVHIDIFGTVLFPIMAFLTGIPLIGWAKPVPVNLRLLHRSSRDNVFVSLAGPISNLLLGLFFFGLLLAMRLAGAFQLQSWLKPLLLIFVNGMYINVLLAVFNLVPIPPLDGSHVLEYFLPYNFRQTWEQIKPYGFLIIIALFYLGLLNILIQPALHVVEFLLMFLQ